MRRVLTGIGGAYMIGILLTVPSLVGTTRSRGSCFCRAAMPFTSLSCATLRPCFFAIESKVSPGFG
jgi:hypothetical protein